MRLLGRELDLAVRPQPGRYVKTRCAALAHPPSSNCCVRRAKLGCVTTMITHSSHPSGVAPRALPLPACGEREGPARREGEGRPAARSDPSDIHPGDWVERYLPARIRPYARLARLDRPIGTWLL